MWNPSSFVDSHSQGHSENVIKMIFFGGGRNNIYLLPTRVEMFHLIICKEFTKIHDLEFKFKTYNLYLDINTFKN